MKHGRRRDCAASDQLLDGKRRIILLAIHYRYCSNNAQFAGKTMMTKAAFISAKILANQAQHG
jgi:hypothetical protein